MTKKGEKRGKKGDMPDKKILIPLDEHGEPYGWGLLIAKTLISDGIPVGTYKTK